MGKSHFLSYILIGIMIVSSLTVLASVSAKDMNLPDGANKVVYYSLVKGHIAVPEGWPVGGLHPATFQIAGLQIVGGSFEECSAITLSIPYSGEWLPVMMFTTDTNYLQFIRTVLTGMPASSPTNGKLLSDDVVKVERNGNRMTVELATDQTVRWGTPSGTYISITIPAFKVELDQLAGSYHSVDTANFTGYTGASGYTRVDDEMGFCGTGAFTCVAWNYENQPMTDCTVVMHGIRTYYPPV